MTAPSAPDKVQQVRGALDRGMRVSPWLGGKQLEFARAPGG
jgi:hypothetical protein